MDEVREVIASLGVRVIRELGVAVHLNPADCHGIAFELYEGFFHDNEALVGEMKPPQFWVDEEPLGLTGLKGCTITVADMDVAKTFFTSLLKAEERYDEARPAIAGRAVGLEVADTVLELLVPTGPGALQRDLERQGEGLRSTVFRVADIDRARRHFAEQKVDVVDGTAPGSIAVPAAANLGVLFEFAE
jgi:hypothetical protein